MCRFIDLQSVIGKTWRRFAKLCFVTDDFCLYRPEFVQFKWNNPKTEVKAHMYPPEACCIIKAKLLKNTSTELLDRLFREKQRDPHLK